MTDPDSTPESQTGDLADTVSIGWAQARRFHIEQRECHLIQRLVLFDYGSHLPGLSWSDQWGLPVSCRHARNVLYSRACNLSPVEEAGR